MLTGKQTWVITGGAGFIGSHIAKELVRQEQNVIILDNFSSGSLNNLSAIRHKIHLIKADIRNFSALEQALHGADYVLHHAALVSVPESMNNPAETAEINIQGTINVLNAARKNRIKRAVFASSSAVYGNGTNTPHSETSALDIQSPYALSKQMGTQLCQLYTRIYGLETVTLRYFNVFGPGQNSDTPYASVIAKFVDQAFRRQPLTFEGDGRQTRDFIHVQDVVQANFLAALSAVPGATYNVARGESHSLIQLADLIEKMAGYSLERIFKPKRAGDVRYSSACIEKIKTLGFRPSVSLEDGLKEIWAQRHH